MSRKVSFTSLGGANFIGASAYVLNFDGFKIGVDRGGQLNGGPSPINIAGSLDHILLSHYHHDHVGTFAQYLKNYPSLRGSATQETIELFRVSSELEIARLNRKKGIDILPFGKEDLARAVENISPVKVGQILDFGKVKVRFDKAGHTLGAVSFNFKFEGKNYIVTNDISFTESPASVIAPAVKPIRSDCCLLVRESTYINYQPEESFEKVESRLVEDCYGVLKKGGQVIIPSLSDRIPHIFSLIWQSGIADQYHVYIEGARGIIDVFNKYSEKALSVLKKAKYFQDRYEIHRLMKSGNPAVIIGTSGMLYPGTLSAKWAVECLPNKRSAIFIVNYQESGGQGQVLLDSHYNDFVVFNETMAIRKCRIAKYNISAHMTGKEGEELEERLQPRTIIYVHGDDKEIERYIAGKSRDKRFRRVKSFVGQEVWL